MPTCCQSKHARTCKHTHAIIHSHTHTQTGLSCPYWVLLFCLCPADGGSEHIQAKRFVSGSGETALLCAQSAPRRKHYLYPLSRSSLHRNSQYQPSPREWVCRTHVHTRIYDWVAVPLSCSISFPLTRTQTHTLLHGTWTAVFLLYGCDPVSRSLLVCVQFSPLFFSLYSPFLNSTQSWPAVYFWPDLVWSKSSPGLSPESDLLFSVGQYRRRLAVLSLS